MIAVDDGRRRGHVGFRMAQGPARRPELAFPEEFAVLLLEAQNMQAFLLWPRRRGDKYASAGDHGIGKPAPGKFGLPADVFCLAPSDGQVLLGRRPKATGPAELRDI